MVQQKPRQKVISIMSFVVMYAALMFLLAQAPLNSDDFIFADLKFTNLLDVLHYVLCYGNGRMLGNLGAVLLVNHPLMVAAVKSAVILGIVYLLPKAAGAEEPNDTVISTLLILGITPELFAQVFTWTSGFMNYVPSVAITLLCMAVLQRKNQEKSRWIALLLFAAGIMGQLYVEHGTLINLVAACAVWIYSCKEKNEHQKTATGAWMLGCMIGAAVMLMIPVVFADSCSPLSGYRKVALDINSLLMNTKDCIYSTLNLFAHSTCLWGIASAAGVLLLGTPKTFAQHIRRLLYLCYPMISLICNAKYESIQSVRSARFIVLCGGLCVYVLCLLFDAFVKIQDRKVKCQLVCYSILACAALAPFCVVRPFAARCVFLSYVFISLAVLRVFTYAKTCNKYVSGKTVRIFQSVAVILSVILCIEFANIGRLDRARTEHIAASMEQGATKITVCEFPSRYTFETWLVHKLYYYENSNDIAFTVVDFCEWIGED